MGGARFYYFGPLYHSNDGVQPLRATSSEADRQPTAQRHDRATREDDEGRVIPMAEAHGTACIACGEELVDTGGTVHCRDCGWNERHGAD